MAGKPIREPLKTEFVRLVFVLCSGAKVMDHKIKNPGIKQARWNILAMESAQGRYYLRKREKGGGTGVHY